MSCSMRRKAGFTLIELLIVVAIVAILAAIAIPNYREYVLRGYRTEARNLLLEVAAQQERYRYGNPGYATTLTLLGRPGTVTSTNLRYVLTMTATPLTYTLTATPQLDQVPDKCGLLTIDHLQVKAATPGDDAECWKR